MTKKNMIWFFFVPPFLILLGITLIPTGKALLMSFQNQVLRYSTYDYVGVQNFVKLFSDRRFLNSVNVSLVWELITVVGTMLVGIGLALFLTEYAKGKLLRFLSLILIFPILLPRISAGFIWKFMYSPILGVINWFLQELGFGPIEFLANPQLALFSVAAVDIWQWGFFYAVIFIKLIESLPPQPQEAAKVEGATRWQVHYYVTLPMLLKSIISLTMVKMVESLRSFDLIYIMTRGGPGIATETLDLYAFRTGLELGGKISYASTIGVFLLISTTIIFTIIWRQASKWQS